MEKQNLSKLKKQDLLNKKSGKKMSAETSLSDELNGDKSFTDQHAEHGDETYGGKIKHKTQNPKFATSSKKDPSNGKLDGEKNLSDKLNKGDKKFADQSAEHGDEKYGDDNRKKGGSTKLGPESSLASKLKFGKGSKGNPSNSSLDAEDHLSDSFTYLMNFGQFVNEAYEEGEEKDDKKDKKKKGFFHNPNVKDEDQLPDSPDELNINVD